MNGFSGFRFFFLETTLEWEEQRNGCFHETRCEPGKKKYNGFSENVA